MKTQKSKKEALKKVAKLVKKAVAKKVAPKKTTIKKVVKPVKKSVAKKLSPKPDKKVAKKVNSRTKKTIKTTVVITTTTTQIAPKETHYLLILDESGSMGSVQKETLSGLNEQIKTIKNLNSKYNDQEYFVSIIKFDDEIVPLFENVPAKKLRELTADDYTPDAMTALHDAIGISVNKLKDNINNKLNSGEADAFVVILTDGAENASKEYNSDKIKNLITSLEKTGLWTFTFIGANQNSVLTAKNLGITSSNTANFVASGVGSSLAFSSLSSSIGKRAAYRSAGVFTNDSYLSEVTCNNSNIGEDASLLDLSGQVSAEDIAKAKLSANTKNTNNQNK